MGMMENGRTAVVRERATPERPHGTVRRRRRLKSPPAARSPGAERNALPELEAVLGYRFADRSLLGQAMTHGSAGGRAAGAPQRARAAQSQRYEFLGDRVLGLIVAQLLLEGYPEAAEGPLTSRSQVLVSTETLAEIADEIGLLRFLETDGTTRQSTKSRKVAADACEAVIGAMFLDGGLPAAKSFVERHWRQRIAAMRTPPRDPKMALQEWALMRKEALPTYALAAAEGPPHAPSFKVEVTLVGHPPAVGFGSSKRRAEQAAAEALLRRIGADRGGGGDDDS